ncbi:MAG: hypothetical protein QGG42_16000 [Phycisphaerae bacterium]|jgi:hypothetical protein|nr:hypothetical protein [Phycisphaerae bacterium]
MNKAITTITAAMTLAIALGALAEEASEKTVRIENRTELLKHNKDLLPPSLIGGGMFRLSPSGNRYMYLRQYPGYKYKLHFGQFKPASTDSPAIWDRALPTFYCRMTLAGIAWRSDSQRVLFLQEMDITGKEGRRMEPWEMKWDVKNPQFGRAKHMKLGDKDSTGCTAASYSPDGKTMWATFSDVKDFKVCGITENVRGRNRSRILYRSTGRGIHYLVPSPDGKFLSWVETYPMKDNKRVPPDVVVADAKSGKIVRRITLSAHIPGWLDAKAPIWTADSAAICYGDVVVINRVWRREVRVTKLSDKTSRVLARDSIAIGAVSGGIVLNRGPACTPMRQFISSYAAPGSITPTTNDVIFRPLAAKSEPITLINNAFAQHVLQGTIVYSQRNGDDILIMRAKLKLPPKGKHAADKSAPNRGKAKKNR